MYPVKFFRYFFRYFKIILSMWCEKISRQEQRSIFIASTFLIFYERFSGGREDDHKREQLIDCKLITRAGSPARRPRSSALDLRDYCAIDENRIWISIGAVYAFAHWIAN